VQVEVFERIGLMPEGHQQLLKRASTRNYAYGVGWFENFVASGLDPAERVCWFALTDTSGECMALLPMSARSPVDMGAPSLRSLANVYSCAFDVVSELPAEHVQVAADALSLALARAQERPAVLQLDALPADGPWLGALLVGLSRAGLLVQPYAYFGTWYEDVEGVDFDAYLAARPSRLRNTLKRKLRRLQKTGEARFVIARTPAAVEEHIAAYETVHERSWKPPEPYPHFMPGLVRRAAADGALTLGVLYRAERPIAAQIWLEAGREATIFKLSYDGEFERDSPGALLTLHMIQDALDTHRITHLNFGRGDDPYKQEWLGERRERWNILAFNPTTTSGIVGALRHLPPYWLKRLMGRAKLPELP
jgi:CelD/BcsL family acetyltransferase involved in cellulose biosynthesis